MSAFSMDAEIRRRIAAAGPMPVHEFMGLCLAHPQHGYYSTRDPLGQSGDFTTAPEISQMFGELIGLWAVAVWQAMDSPSIFRLVELGPGRGTLMRDALRAAQLVADFHAAASVHLIEISPVMVAAQRQTLTGLGVPIEWHRTLEEVPSGPLIVIANEFFDALPVHQAVRLDDGWHERTIEIGKTGGLAFATAREVIPQFDQLLPARLRNAPVGACYEWRADRTALELGRRLADESGAALVIDYGHAQSGHGETLQAVGDHAYADPLAEPGAVDLTAHVDFQALADAVESMGARAHGPVTQSEFLRRLGIEVRAERLKAGARPGTASEIDAALMRLTGAGRADMGELFKVIGFADRSRATLPGLEGEHRGTIV